MYTDISGLISFLDYMYKNVEFYSIIFLNGYFKFNASCIIVNRLGLMLSCQISDNKLLIYWLSDYTQNNQQEQKTYKLTKTNIVNRCALNNKLK